MEQTKNITVIPARRRVGNTINKEVKPKLKVAAETVGLKIFHGSAGRMLRNTHYLGDDYYPAIKDQELFDKAEEERQSRASQLGRVRELKGKEMPAVPLCFTMGRQTKVFYDPFEQAEYAYSLIESEMNANGNS